MKGEKSFHSITTVEAFEAVHSSTRGLTSAEAKKRVAEFGPNALPTPQRAGWVVLFFKQFKSFLILILLVAAAVSYALHDATDAIIILAAVLMNVVVGFIQEGKAERALEALRTAITLKAKVLRDGGEMIVPIEDLVPGDVVLLDAGDKVPADGRLIDVTELETNEAPLTGESASIVKQLKPVDPSSVVGDQTNMVFFGTTATRGSGHALVVRTGLQTELGRIAALLRETKSAATPLQQKLDSFARGIGIGVLVISAGIFVVGFLQGMPFVEIFTTAVAIAVSAIPEGLTVAVTIILAIGMQRILKRNALVRRLQAAETLGSTSVICTDKTGTLTEGNMRVVSLMTHDYHFDRIHEVERHEGTGLREMVFALNIGMLCNDAHVIQPADGAGDSVIVGNLTERALLGAGIAVGLDQKKLLADEPRIATVPFDSTSKFMATLHQHPKGGHRLYVKGAPEKVMDRSSKVRVGTRSKKMGNVERKKFDERFIDASRQGLRMLALAYKDVPKKQTSITEDDVSDLIFVGYVGIQDPLRHGIAETFQRTSAAGIRTIMITGDHKLTAQAIAREIGLPAEEKNILVGDDLHNMTQDQLNKVVTEISVYARVSPEDKLNIIQAWQSKGKVVAMTGDGVNDSPALKAADVGIALGSGTDVAKEVADLVLLDDNYQTIVSAVEEGRGLFDNIRKVTLYLMSDAFSEVLLIASALIVGIPLPLTAAQILWINLVADGLPGVALTLDPKEKESMDEPPRSRHEPIMNGEMKVLAVTISVVTGLGMLGVFWYFWSITGNEQLSRSIVFATLALDSLIYVFSVRSLRHSLFSKSFFSNMWLLGAVVIGFLIQVAALYVPFLQRLLHTVPLSAAHWGVVVGVAVLVIILIEFIKFTFIISRRRHAHRVVVA